MSFFVVVMTIVSCSSSDDGSGEGGGNQTTSITLSASANTVFVDNQVTFSVVDDLGNDLTSQATYKVNGSTVSNPYTFNQLGSYDIVASYLSFTSNIATVLVTSQSDLTLLFNFNPATTDQIVTFVVLNNVGVDVTSESTFTLDGNSITSPYQFVNIGTNTVIASYDGLSTSSNIEITRSFTKKALLEDFTGTWCPNCPPAAAAIASATSANENVFGVSYHDGVNGYPDPMEISETSFWSGYYNVTGFPTVYVNGPDTRWNFPNMAQVNGELSELATCGLALDASITGGQLNVEVRVAFNTVPNEAVQLMLYLVEDNITTNSSQAGSSQGANYLHRDVLREVYTNQLGDVIPAGSISLSQDYVRNFTSLTLPTNIDDTSNLKVIAFVRNTYTKTFTDYFGEVHTNSPHYDIYNVQEVEVGSSIDFD
ncbi:Omp28-related outer membrane protein [Psychroserpens luteus]|uniref:Omp28-related outer membrane protein n=1 Tax=Psychroserpens luteus TaxID=1434066 RepID=A0ABW5ZZE6_9FLAO|nr:Omp28-related outer membrane protein [Psychroserpens luteus]